MTFKRSGHLRLLSASILLGASFGVTAGSSGTAEARPTCFGKPATIVGTSGDDHNLNGTGRDDVIVGLGGTDTINGRGGDDLLCGGRGGDAIYGDGECGTAVGADRISGGPALDSLHGEMCPPGHPDAKGRSDLIRGDGGHDFISGGVGSDRLNGGPGIDEVMITALGPARVNLTTGESGGGEGNDRLARGSFEGVGVADCRDFKHVIVGDHSENFIDGGNGRDVIRGRGGPDHITGDGEHPDSDICPGGAADRIIMGAGKDGADGYSGDDYFHGGPGNDGVNAGSGRDECVSVETSYDCEKRS